MSLDWDSEEVTCPSCGARQGDLWDFNWRNGDEEKEVDCGSCCKPYTLHRSISVDYAASQCMSQTKGEP